MILQPQQIRSSYYFQTQNRIQETKIPYVQQNEDWTNRNVSMRLCANDCCPPAPRLSYLCRSKARDLARDNPTQGEALWRLCSITKDSGFREGGRCGRLTKGRRRRKRRCLSSYFKSFLRNGKIVLNL